MLGVEVVGLVVLAGASGVSGALLGNALAGCGVGLIYPATAAMTLHRSTRSPGLAVGAMTSLWDLGILAAGALGGLIADRVGYRAAFVVAAVAGLVALALTVALRRAARAAGPESVRRG